MTIKDRVKRFILLTTSPHTLTQLEITALWTIARYENQVMYETGDQTPFIWTGKTKIIILWHIIGALEKRGLIKEQLEHPLSITTWDIVWENTEAFEQIKELRVQKAVGSI